MEKSNNAKKPRCLKVHNMETDERCIWLGPSFLHTSFTWEANTTTTGTGPSITNEKPLGGRCAWSQNAIFDAGDSQLAVIEISFFLWPFWYLMLTTNQSKEIIIVMNNIDVIISIINYLFFLIRRLFKLEVHNRHWKNRSIH